MKQMDFVDNDELYKINVSALATLPCYNVPFLGSRHDDLRLVDLGASQVDIAGQLFHADSEVH